MKLDLGCGAKKEDGYIGVDINPGPQVDVVCNLGKDHWPFEDDSVDEARCIHMLEHMEGLERVHFINELYRILKKGGKVYIQVPHWAASRAYGDMTHKWPPISEWWFYYLSPEWRKANIPHDTLYNCNFEATWGYIRNQQLDTRNQEYKNFAFQWYKESIQDIVANLTKK